MTIILIRNLASTLPFGTWKVLNEGCCSRFSLVCLYSTFYLNKALISIASFEGKSRHFITSLGLLSPVDPKQVISIFVCSHLQHVIGKVHSRRVKWFYTDLYVPRVHSKGGIPFIHHCFISLSTSQLSFPFYAKYIYIPIFFLWDYERSSVFSEDIEFCLLIWLGIKLILVDVHLNSCTMLVFSNKAGGGLGFCVVLTVIFQLSAAYPSHQS